MESSQFFSKQMRKKSIKYKIARIKHAAWNVSKLHSSSSSSTSTAVKVSLERHEVEKFSRERQ